MKIKLGIFLVTLLSVSFSVSSKECITKVNKIESHINGGVWFKFTDNAALYGGIDKVGLDRTLSIALTALTTDKNVKLIINDTANCGTNIVENWEYITLYRQ